MEKQIVRYLVETTDRSWWHRGWRLLVGLLVVRRKSLCLCGSDHNRRDSRRWALAVGLLIYTELTALPVIGGILTFVAFLFTLGAIALGVRFINSISRQRSADAVDEEYSPGAEAVAD